MDSSVGHRSRSSHMVQDFSMEIHHQIRHRGIGLITWIGNAPFSTSSISIYPHQCHLRHRDSSWSSLPHSTKSSPLPLCDPRPDFRCGFISVLHQFPMSATRTSFPSHRSEQPFRPFTIRILDFFLSNLHISSAILQPLQAQKITAKLTPWPSRNVNKEIPDAHVTVLMHRANIPHQIFAPPLGHLRCRVSIYETRILVLDSHNRQLHYVRHAAVPQLMITPPCRVQRVDR